MPSIYDEIPNYNEAKIGRGLSVMAITESKTS